MVMELTMNAFLVCTTLQTGLAVSMYGQGLLPMLKGFLQDLTGGGNPPRSKEEALARRRRQVSLPIFLPCPCITLTHIRTRPRTHTDDKEIAADDGIEGDANRVDGSRYVCDAAPFPPCHG